MIGKGISWSLVWVCLVSAAGISPGQEQWLAYRSSANPESVTGPLSGRSEKVLDQAPEDLALPTFQADKPLFFRWPAKRPVGSGQEAASVSVWFAVDRSRKTGPHDLLYVDSNLDGSLADEKPLKATETQFESDYERTRFTLVKVLLPGEDGPVAYHLNVQLSIYRGEERVYLTSACWYEGMVTVGDKQVWCAVIDSNLTGRFDGASLRYDKGDRIRITDKPGEPYSGFETDTSLRPLAKHVEIDGKLFPVTVAADGSSVTFLPAVEIPTGTVRVGTSASQVRLFGPQGYFIRQVADGAISVPEGEYSLVLWKVSRKDDPGATWDLFAMVADSKNAPKVTVEPGKDAALDIGEPIIGSLESTTEGQGRHAFNCRLKGRGGESVQIVRNGQRAAAPKLRIVSSDGTYDKTFSLEYG